jgi:phage tail protein X
MTNYTVKDGETITDVCLNATGSILYWPDILEANNFTDWTPVLISGQKIIIPDVQLQTNVLQEISLYPACNRPEIINLDAQIADAIALINETGLYLFEDDSEEYLFDDDGINFIFNN